MHLGKSEFAVSWKWSLAARSIPALGVLIPLGGCLKKNNLNDSVKSLQSGAEFSLADYVEKCEKALGTIPKLDCAEIDEVVIWARDAAGKPVRITDENVPGKSIRFQKGVNCVNPSLAGPPDARCMPFAHIGALPGTFNASVVWLADCRRADVLLPFNTPSYESIGLIGHNRETGATCFFDTKRMPQGVSGKDIPNPNEHSNPPSAPRPEQFWLSPREMGSSEATRCVRCHSAYPWIRTPAVMHRDVAKMLGVQNDPKYFDLEAAVPRKFDPGIPKDGHKRPYFIVAREGLESVSSKGLWTPKVDDLEEVKPCQACHRMGGGVFVAREAAQALGMCEFEDHYNGHCKGVDPMVQFDWHQSIFNVPHWTGVNGNPVRQKAASKLYAECYLSETKEKCQEKNLELGGTIF